LIGGRVGPRIGLDDMERRKFLILMGLKLEMGSSYIAVLPPEIPCPFNVNK
jgi:hypothetical protein